MRPGGEGDPAPDPRTDPRAAANDASPPTHRSIREGRHNVAAPLDAGTQIGRYLVIDCIGSGGVGQVYRAYDPKLGREVAVKLLHSRYRESGEGRSQDELRMMREAQAMARLAHPNVVPVFDVEETEHGFALAMEFVPGTTLHEWQSAEGGSIAEALDLFVQAGRGLAAAHRAGIIHRDFKPGNVLIDRRDGRARVTDFGLARHADSQEQDHTAVDNTEAAGAADSDPTGAAARRAAAHDAKFRAAYERARSSSSMVQPVTAAGSVIGTPAYMSPEAIAGQRVDEQSDQFSFCVALYEAIYGRRPDWSSDGPLAAIPPEGPSRFGSPVPTWLSRIVMRGLVRDPSARWPSMSALADELEGTPIRQRRSRTAAIILAFAGLISASSYVVRDDTQAHCAADRYAHQLVWTPARRTALASSFAVARGDSTFERIADTLDAYQSQWLDARTETCRATHVTHDQSEAAFDRSVVCLDQRRHELDAVLDVLEEDPARVLEHAVEMVANLRQVETCRDHTFLAAAVPLPEDPQVREAVAFERERLARATALRDAGRLDDATRLAQAVLARAEELGYPPLSVDANLQLGFAASVGGARQRARELLTQAYFAALKQSQFPQAVRAASRLSYVLATFDQQTERALEWMQHADALLPQVEADPDITHEVLGSLAVALTTARRFDEAERMMSEALELARVAHGDEHLHVAILYNNMCYVLWARDDIEDGFDYFVTSLDMQLRLLPHDSPALIRILDNATAAFTEMGRLDEGREFAEWGLDLLASDDAHRDYYAASLHSNLAANLLKLGEPKLSAHHARLALERHRRGDTSEQDTAGSHAALASALLALDRREEAATHFVRALTLRGETNWTTPGGAATGFDYAQLAWELGHDRDEAVRVARRAYAAAAADDSNRELRERIVEWFAMHALDDP